MLIQVAATSFNPSDIGLRRGLLRSVFPLSLPYTATHLADAMEGPVDAILNLVVVSARQAATLARSVRPGGVVVSATVPVKAPTGSLATAVHFVARNDTSHLTALVKLVDAGAVQVDIATSRPLADLASVHRAAESGRTRGKIILVP